MNGNRKGMNADGIGKEKPTKGGRAGTLCPVISVRHFPVQGGVSEPPVKKRMAGGQRGWAGHLLGVSVYLPLPLSISFFANLSCLIVRIIPVCVSMPSFLSKNPRRIVFSGPFACF